MVFGQCIPDSTMNTENSTLLKKCPYSDYSGPHFLAFGLNTEKYGVSLVCSPIVEKCGPEQLPIRTLHALLLAYPPNKYMFKANNQSTRNRCEIC